MPLRLVSSDLVPLLAGHLLELGRREDAGIGAEHVEAAMRALRLPRWRARCSPAIVTSAARPMPPCRFRQPPPSPVRRGAPRSRPWRRAREHAGNAFADALDAAGHDHRPALERLQSCSFSPMKRGRRVPLSPIMFAMRSLALVHHVADVAIGLRGSSTSATKPQTRPTRMIASAT